jgi:hypothetical protein
MNKKRSPRSVQEAATDAPAPTSPEAQTTPDLVETAVAPAAIERALAVYQQLHPRDQSVIVQARKILTQHIYGMVDQGERDEQRLTVGGLAQGHRAGPRYKVRSRSRDFAGLTFWRRGSSEDRLDDGARTDLDRRRPEIRT